MPTLIYQNGIICSGWLSGNLDFTVCINRCIVFFFQIFFQCNVFRTDNLSFFAMIVWFSSFGPPDPFNCLLPCCTRVVEGI